MNSARVGTTTFDFRKAMNVPRLVGIWRMMTDFRLAYFGATAALALSALAKTSMFILLGYFADRVWPSANSPVASKSPHTRT